MEKFFIYFFSIISAISAAYLLFSKNVLYAAFSLLVALLGVSGLFIALGAEYVGVSQLMVYAGGIIVLILFAIMLSSKGSLDKNYLNLVNQNYLAYGFSLLVGLTLIYSMLFGLNFNMYGNNKTNIDGIGLAFLGQYILAFELLGIVLLMALIGAVYLAKKKN